MQQTIAHRGPDGRGTYLAPSRRAALTHTRLAIIDLNETGAQPMTTSCGRYTISFNGEIYNYQSLREQLTHDGITLNSQSDTEVIMQLYAQHGADCVKLLRGMYAFLIWDEHEKSAFAARDPFGIKPFYYQKNSQSLTFASEVRAIIASKTDSPQLCATGLKSYFKTGTVTEPNTIFDSIKMLPAGHTLKWKSGQITLDSFWKPMFTEYGMSRDHAIKTTRRALKNSIKAHLVSDVPVGIFLSGGIDSAVLVALASQATPKKINTYSIAFSDAEWNEGDVAKRLSDHFGTRHTELLMTADKAQPLFAQYLATIDQPTIDGFNTFCVANLASTHGEKVVLSGLGGDEMFAGYKSFTLLPKMLRLSKMLSLASPLVRFASHLLNPILSARSRRILDFLGRPDSLIDAQQSLRGIFSNSESIELVKQTLAQNNQHAEQSSAPLKEDKRSAADSRLEQPITRPALADQISQLELTTYMRNQLLRDSDVASMASGVELRVPFVDQVLFDELASIPSMWRLELGKKLLIDSVPELPEWVVNRPKQGFRFPFDEWFSDTWVEPASSTQRASKRTPLKSRAPNWLKLEPWYRRWSILVLDDWLRRHANAKGQVTASSTTTKSPATQIK